MIARRLGIAAALLAVILTPTTAFAGGKHGSNNGAQAISCSVSGSTVTASGLPTDQLVNFMVTTSAGTTGWVLGYTPDGAWSVNVPAVSGSTTYQFVSRTSGSDGSKYTVFASCSA